VNFFHSNRKIFILSGNFSQHFVFYGKISSLSKILHLKWKNSIYSGLAKKFPRGKEKNGKKIKIVP
jgi:hypothetical protein